MRKFADLDQREILALAISLEEEHGRIYADYAAGLGTDYPASAKIFTRDGRRRERASALADRSIPAENSATTFRLFAARTSPASCAMIRSGPSGRLDSKRCASRLKPSRRRRGASIGPRLSARPDAEVRKLLGDLIAAEDQHIGIAQHISEVELTTEAKSAEEQAERRAFVLQYVQPGLTGLIDGSVSTLAPIFAAAFATHNTWQTFLVGLAASVGAGISMAFAEALADDGQISGRGNPWVRGGVTGLMTTLGGLGHTLPYLIADFWTATTIAIAVVFVELWIIAGIRARFMDTKFFRAALEVVVGGLIVFAVGILIGSA